MKRSILNIILSFFLIFQFSLGEMDILFNMSNISKANELDSIETCGEEGEGCIIIGFWFLKKCLCPPKPENKHT